MKSLLLNGAIDVNCYLVETANGWYIIDPGSDIEQLKEETKNLNLKGILLTHGHADHIGCIGYFDLPIYLHRLEMPMITDNSINCFRMLNEKPAYDASKLKLIPIDDGMNIDGFLVMHTPGHTRGSVSYLYKNKLFSGDTLFKESIGRTDLPTGDLAAMKKSVLKIMNLNDDINVYPGHGEKTNIKHERKANPYYQYWK